MNIKVTNLGDVNPLDYGGFFLIERSGEGAEDYQAVECIVIELDNPDEQEEENQQYTVYRFVPELCFEEYWYTELCEKIVSDNPYHKDSPAWFAKPEEEKKHRPQDSTYLSNVCSFVGMLRKDFVGMLCSDNPVERAIAYRDIGEYHGFDNLDNYPLQFASRNEIVEWMKLPAYQLGEYV